MVSSEVIEFEPGQIWRNRHRKRDTTSMFIIEKVECYGDLYQGHSKPEEQRITGHQVSYQECRSRTMHGKSLRAMFPYPVYIPEDPYFHFETEDK